MLPPSAASFRSRLRDALTAAIKERDSTATRALRSVLAAIDNAEAVDMSAAPRSRPGTIAGAVPGLGAGEVARRTLTDEEMRGVLRDAIAERKEAAVQYTALGRSDDASHLHDEVAVLGRFLNAR